MALTEEEAKTKWCPHVIASHTNPRGGFNPGQTVDLRDHVCIASRCMSWRWSDPATLNEQGGSAAEYSSPTRRGYCGLAGEPK